MKKLTIAIATYNEERNIYRALHSIKDIADEIILVDGGSTDKTVDIARQYNVQIIETDNPLNFHRNKKKAIEAATGEWIFQLDADEEVSSRLAMELKSISEGTEKAMDTIEERKRILFERHQQIIESRDHISRPTSGSINGYYVPRRNFFLGKPMTYAGMYPDGVIRLFKKGKGTVPAESVHEQIKVEGRVGWLSEDLNHYSNPTLRRYIKGANIYTDLLAKEINTEKKSIILKLFIYFLEKPLQTFFSLLIVHKGILDGFHGFLFSLFSAMHYPVAFIKSLHT